jgi:hypothetical protein
MSESDFIAPAYHSYLGDGLRDMHRHGPGMPGAGAGGSTGASIGIGVEVDPDTVHEPDTVLLIPLPGVVLFPGGRPMLLCYYVIMLSIKPTSSMSIYRNDPSAAKEPPPAKAAQAHPAGAVARRRGQWGWGWGQ